MEKRRSRRSTRSIRRVSCGGRALPAVVPRVCRIETGTGTASGRYGPQGSQVLKNPGYLRKAAPAEKLRKKETI